MAKKIVIIGGVAGGASTAARLRRMDEQAEIIILEKGEHISFANCGLPYHIGDVIPEREKLLVQTPEAMKARFKIDVRIKNEALKINRQQKTLDIKDLATGETYQESYDKLVLSPGARPIKPPLPGLDLDQVFTLRNIPDTDQIKNYLDQHKPDRAVVVGGGFIGLEMAENLHERGLEVSLVEMMDQLMGALDYEMAAQLHNHLRTKGIDLQLGDGITGVEEAGSRKLVNLQSGKSIKTDLVILAIGVKPNTELAAQANLEIGPTGGIKVNEYLQTSDPDIYAIGDAIEVKDFVSENPTMVPLAGPANKQGRIAADNISGRQEKYQGTQGTAIAKAFDLAVASTGLAEKKLQELGIDYHTVHINSNNHAGYYPGAVPMFIKLLFSPEGTVLGAQIVGYEGVDKRIDIFATAVRHKFSIYDLQELELAYAPPYGSAKDPVNMVGFAAGNLLQGEVENTYWQELKDIDPAKTVLLDVREEVETQLGVIKNSINIPLNELRDRLVELDQDKEYVSYCAVGLRGYIAARILSQHGFKVSNLSGGYKLYKAVKDDQEKVIEAPDEANYNSASNPEEANQIGLDMLKKGQGKLLELDACGLQCPGPIMQVYKKMEKMKQGDILEVKATDPGFKQDIRAWAKNTGNTVLSIEEEAKIIKVTLLKGALESSDSQAVQTTPGTGKQANLAVQPTKKGKTMVVFSGELDKAIASFIIANGAAAMGNDVTLFFTFWGLNILRKDGPISSEKNVMEKMFAKMMPQGSKKLPLSNMNMLGIGPKMIRGIMDKKGVDSLEELINQAQDNGVRLVACQMTMDMLGIKKEELLPGVEVGGVATFLGAADESNMSLFI